MASEAIISTLGGCVGCQAAVEHMQKQIPDCLNLLTLVNYVFIACEGVIFETKFFSVPRKIPITAYLEIIMIYFIVSACNNYALKFDVYFPLFIVFKSSSLLFHMILRNRILGQYFNLKQVLTILIVSSGVVIFTLASYNPNKIQSQENLLWLRHIPFPPFVIGVSLLSIAVLLSSYLGICQERLYQKYGPHAREVMTYVHFLSIPMFAIFGDDLSNAITAAHSSRNFIFFDIEFPVPSAWVILLISSFLNWICVNNVYRLSALTSSLNVNMVISLRKFISLVISFAIFNNDFNILHLVGGIVVFLGTIMYTHVF
ncbi:unnamed protein product [Auanema sp. JU1783]|nr:unnamed protein product [Auanema sp. JU1783]